MKWPIYQRALHHHETDADGVCHFSNYLRIAEEALFHALITLGFAEEVTARTFVVIRSTAEYKRSIFAFEAFSVEMIGSSISRATFGVMFAVRSSGYECAAMQFTLMAVNERKEPCPLPQSVRTFFMELNKTKRALQEESV